jgi:hypothetical protein
MKFADPGDNLLAAKRASHPDPVAMRMQIPVVTSRNAAVLFMGSTSFLLDANGARCTLGLTSLIGYRRRGEEL